MSAIGYVYLLFFLVRRPRQNGLCGERRQKRTWGSDMERNVLKDVLEHFAGSSQTPIWGGVIASVQPNSDSPGQQPSSGRCLNDGCPKGLSKKEEHRISWGGTLVMSSPTSEVLEEYQEGAVQPTIQSLHVRLLGQSQAVATGTLVMTAKLHVWAPDCRQCQTPFLAVLAWSGRS